LTGTSGSDEDDSSQAHGGGEGAGAGTAAGAGEIGVGGTGGQEQEQELRQPFFRIVGSVDGISEQLDASAEDPDNWVMVRHEHSCSIVHHCLVENG
jgi:hypothetical protein